MFLLVGRFVLLGCIYAVLVLADVATDKPLNLIPVNDAVTEKLIKSHPEIDQRIQTSETTSSPDKNSKIFNNPNVKEGIDREIVVIHDQSTGGSGHNENEHHDHHGHHEDYHEHHHENEYHHPPPFRQPPPHHHHDHHHPPPNYHHYPPPYPGYYPPHYPAYHHAIPPPMYPYYPSMPYYNSPPMKPSTTIIQTSTGSGTNGQNLPKPTDLLNQGTEYLWNLFGKIGASTGENHEVVVIKPKPVPSQPVASMQMLPPGWYSNKGRVPGHIDCNNKNEKQ